MPFRFRKKEPLPTGIRRIVRERIDDAMVQLTATGDERHEGIHNARNRFKEIRALLRLARSELGEQFAVENRWYRDIARELSETRDARAVIETWNKLVSRYPEEAERLEAASIHTRLEQRLYRVTEEDLDSNYNQPLLRLHEELKSARERAGQWPIRGSGFSVIETGLMRVYATGRKNMKQAYTSGTDESFHEWRKRVKDLWYHTRLLRPLWDQALQVRQKHLKTLSDTIGNHHDLAIVKKLLDTEPHLFGLQPRRREELLEIIERRQGELRTEGHRLGALIYAEKPKAYMKRIKAYWKIWRAEEINKRKNSTTESTESTEKRKTRRSRG